MPILDFSFTTNTWIKFLTMKHWPNEQKQLKEFLCVSIVLVYKIN